MMIIVGFIAAIIGGAVCSAIATRASNAAKGLAVLVLVLGLLSAGYEMFAPVEEKPSVREGEITMMDATMNAKQPTYMLIANPIIGVFGVLIGAGFVRKRGAAPAT